MNELKIILILSAVFAISLNGQAQMISISPSIFYTYGDYSNGNRSSSIASYGTVGINNIDFVTLGIEKILIDDPYWNYDQFNFSVGLTKNFYPFYINANYMNVNGTLSLKDESYESDDFLNIYNIGVIYNYKRIFTSGNYSYSDLNGFKSVIIRQYQLGIEWLATDDLTISVKPTHSNLSDGRLLYSLSGSLIFKPLRIVTTTVSGFIGERAYFFNNELLTVFNQDETQKSMYELKVQYQFTNKFQITGSFQKSEFQLYKINYYIFGIKAFF